jgi:hypothetical protein
MSVCRRRVRPLQFFIVCARKECGAVKAVPTQFQQRRQKYCSRRCVGIVCGPVTRLTPSQRLAAAKKSKRVRNALAAARLRKLSKLEVYRLAFSVGWKAGARSARRRMQITPGDRT